MEIWYIHLRKSLEIPTSPISLENSVYIRHYAEGCMPSFNPIMDEGNAALFNCTAVVQTSDSMTASM